MTALLRMLDTRQYRERAACKDLDPEFFVSSHSHQQAAKVCSKCPVTANCFFEAVASDVEGTWGGVFFPSGRSMPGKRRGMVDPRHPLVARYRAALAGAMGLTRTQFVERYGESVYAIKTALEDIR